MASTNPADWPLWGVTVGWPAGITHEELGVAPHVSQARVLVRGRSRAAAARAFAAAGLYHDARSADHHLKDYGCPTHNAHELETVQDHHVYVTGGYGAVRTILPLPTQKES
jgi:hypothetical protein